MYSGQPSLAAREAMADLRLAAWFLWITPLLTALSSWREAAWASSAAFAVSPASAASRNRRMCVRRADLMALLCARAFSFVLFRLIWDLMFATGKEPSRSSDSGFVLGPLLIELLRVIELLRARPFTIPVALRAAQMHSATARLGPCRTGRGRPTPLTVG